MLPSLVLFCTALSGVVSTVTAPTSVKISVGFLGSSGNFNCLWIAFKDNLCYLLYSFRDNKNGCVEHAGTGQAQ